MRLASPAPETLTVRWRTLAGTASDGRDGDRAEEHEHEDIAEANRKQAEAQRKHMDWAGIALMSVGLGALQYVLEEGNRNDWFDSKLILGLTLLSVACLVAFVIVELQAKAPAVDLRLFQDKAFAAGSLVSALMFSMLMSLTFLLPVFMQELLGFTSMQSGLALMPRTLVMMVATPATSTRCQALEV